jgi:TPP-dependent indolepyruvate ferredoxin oxidoreductase alpha subunit
VVGNCGCGPVCAWALADSANAAAANAADNAFNHAGLTIEDAVLNNVRLTGNNSAFFSMAWRSN